MQINQHAQTICLVLPPLPANDTDLLLPPESKCDSEMAVMLTSSRPVLRKGAPCLEDLELASDEDVPSLQLLGESDSPASSSRSQTPDI